MRIIDRRNQALGGQGNDRTLNQITHIVIHHSANIQNLNNVRTANFENSWRNSPAMGAPNARGGYHEVVLANGDVEINYNDRRIIWGARNQNTHTWHIAVVGQHGAGVNNITATQLRSLERRIADAYRRMGITNVNRIVTHNGLPGQATACTSVNIANVRTAVTRLLAPAIPSQPAQPTPPSNATTHTVRSGETLSGIANQHRTTVAELTRLNNLANPNVIRVGQVLRLPVGATASTPALRVNGRVRVNNNASTWLTGQPIPAWVRGETYTVQQLRNNNTEVLIGRNGVATGWIRSRDVTPV